MIEILDHTQASLDRPKPDTSTRTRLARTALEVLAKLRRSSNSEHTRHSHQEATLSAADLISNVPPTREKGRHRPDHTQRRVREEAERRKQEQERIRYTLALKNPSILLAPHPDPSFGVAHFHPPEENAAKQPPSADQKK